MASGQLICQPPTFHWPSEDQQTAFKEWQSHHTCVGSIQHPPRKMVCQHCRFPGHQRLQVMATTSIYPKKDKEKKCPENMFKAFTDNLEVSTSQWNYINEMYSDIRQGEQETTDQLDQHIKILVERCGYMSPDEKTQC